MDLCTQTGKSLAKFPKRVSRSRGSRRGKDLTHRSQVIARDLYGSISSEPILMDLKCSEHIASRYQRSAVDKDFALALLRLVE